MYLLILADVYKQAGKELEFTFHNVSINSTMSAKSILNTASFTFHNVSINSNISQLKTRLNKEFTFHNVSINSRTSDGEGGFITEIYIP